MTTKTLKDFEIEHGRDFEPSYNIVISNELRAEAIKWVKADIEDYRNWNFRLPDGEVGREIHNFIVGQRKKWIKFFNLTEDDLK